MKRREFITILGGAAATGRLRCARSSRRCRWSAISANHRIPRVFLRPSGGVWLNWATWKAKTRVVMPSGGRIFVFFRSAHDRDALCVPEMERFGPQGREEKMGRKFIDCREFPSEMNCTLALSADNEDELLEAAVQHAITVHGHEDTPDLRTMIRTAMRDGTPPVEAPRRAA